MGSTQYVCRANLHKAGSDDHTGVALDVVGAADKLTQIRMSCGKAHLMTHFERHPGLLSFLRYLILCRSKDTALLESTIK